MKRLILLSLLLAACVSVPERYRCDAIVIDAEGCWDTRKTPTERTE